MTLGEAMAKVLGATTDEERELAQKELEATKKELTKELGSSGIKITFN